MNHQSRVIVGDKVAWRTELRGPRFTGVAIEFRKSEKHPWHVFVVRRSDGREIEVHPDRLVKDDGRPR